MLSREQAVEWNKIYSGFDRFILLCPQCKTGGNARFKGGNDRCFHCGSCGFVECIATSPETGRCESMSEQEAHSRLLQPFVSE